MLVGENGIITNARLASLQTKFASYKEEMEINIIDAIAGDKIKDRKQVILLGENVKKYISNLEDTDIGKFGIIRGELYYIGNDELGKKAAESQAVVTIPEGMNIEEFVDEMERLAIEESLMQMTGNAFVSTGEDGNTQRVGVDLVDKTAGSNWKIIVETEENNTVATYGTGWTYVKAGTKVDGLGTLTHGYIINFNDKKMVEFNAKKHTMLAYGSKLAVTDGLFFEISPTMIEEKDIMNDIEFGGYSDISEAYTKSSFIFDGVDDYIELPYDSKTELKNGFTFQFYGKFLGAGTNYLKSGKTNSNGENCIPFTDSELEEMKDDDLIYDTKPSPNYPISDKTYTSVLSGIMCAYGPPTGLEVKNDDGWDAFIRFGLLNDDKNGFGFRYNIGHKYRQDDFRTPYSNNDFVFNQELFFKDVGLNNFKYGDDINIVVCVDGQNFEQTYYIDGQEVSSGSYSKSCWNDFLETITSRIECYFIGRTSCDNEWHYGNMEIYGLALYNRPLTPTEILANNNALVAYHNILENNGNAGTGGATGGEDF